MLTGRPRQGHRCLARDRRIAQRYEDGEPIPAIAASEEVDLKTVRNVARRAALPLRRPAKTARNQRILTRYVAGDAVVTIACDEGVGSSYVSTLARRSCLPPRRGWQRKYPVDETAFDEPSSVGWWLIGLLAADGSINDKQHRTSLSQRGEDADVLHAFLGYVGASERPLTESSWRNRPSWCRAEGHYYEARVFSARICQALASHGVVPRKSRSLRFGREAAGRPEVWLGFLDGDGSVLTNSANERPPQISFYGPERVMRQCSAFWDSRLKLHTAKAPAVTYHGRGLYAVSVHGANAARAARQMIDSSDISLRRKRLLLEEVCGAKLTHRNEKSKRKAE